MTDHLQIPNKVTLLLVYGRPFLVFGGMLCAFGVMWTCDPALYSVGVLLLFISMSFDLVDRWFSARFRPFSKLAHLADRILDKIVFSIIFPLVAVGMMWRLRWESPDTDSKELLHAIFVLILCITVLIRDNFATFMRGFALRRGQEPEQKEFTRLRTVVSAPVALLLYAHAFYVPEGPDSPVYLWISWLGNLPLRSLFVIEIIFLVINFGSIAAYCRKYGTYCLDELCLNDEVLRRRILSFFPNALTIMNAMMGVLAISFAYQGQIREAYLMLIGATIFDKLDGALARKLGLAEEFPHPDTPRRVTVGGLLDDVSDALSFCIAPAWIFHLTMAGLPDPWFRQAPVGFIAILYGALGIGRLIYFTLDRTPIPGFFKGMPTPAAALMSVAPLIMLNQALETSPEWVRFWGIFSMGTFILSAILMNLYFIRYLHFGRFLSRHPWFARWMAILALIFVFTPFFGHAAFLGLVLYTLSPLVTGRIRPETAAREHKSRSGK
jgi:CDP-diacylglycerol---serine O-phosphatidyltransferase